MAGLGFDYRPHFMASLRAGGGFFYMCLFGGCDGMGGVFVGASGLFGSPNHKFELGLEYTNFPGDSDTEFISPLTGYRYQPARGGVFVRATVQVLMRVGDSDVLPWPGLGLGAAL